MKTGLELAIEKAGGAKALAVLVRVSIQTLINWKSRGVPAERCPDIELATGVRCEELRPDVNWAVLRGSGSTQEAA